MERGRPRRTLSLLGLCCSWCGVCNSVMFAEMVPESLRTQVYAFDRSFEGAVGACGAPLVGIVAERWFGFVGSVASAAAAEGERAAAAKALSNALYVCLGKEKRACLLCLTSEHLSERKPWWFKFLMALVFVRFIACAVFPWVLCLAFYSFLHCTYPRDKAAAAKAARAEGGAEVEAGSMGEFEAAALGVPAARRRGIA